MTMNTANPSTLRALTYLLGAFLLLAIYAPFICAGDPIWVYYEGEHHFPLLSHLFSREHFSKSIDLFFNLTIFTFPLYLFIYLRAAAQRGSYALALLFLQVLIFVIGLQSDERHFIAPKVSQEEVVGEWSWEIELSRMTQSEKIDALWQHLRKERIQEEQARYLPSSLSSPLTAHSKEKERVNAPHGYKNYLEQKKRWIEQESQQLKLLLLPLWRLWYWEENTGADQQLNPHLPWDQRSRLNRKDLTAALIYGMRICIVVGTLSVALSLLIGIPVGALSAYLGGRWDMLIMRLIEIWESFPYFFLLLFITSVLQNKSLFLIIAVIGLFGWSGFARFTRAEVLKQARLPYVESCFVMGLSHLHILFRQILPNSLAPVLTLLPFAIMGAIGAEASLAFLGLSEEGSCSWGTLMDEGRKSFPAESYLLWPPAILLTVLLVTIALIGDALRDAHDPRLKR